MAIYNTIYVTLILLGAVIAFITWKKGQKRYLLLSILLLITFAQEATIPYLIEKEIDFTYLYHLFTLVEYPFLCTFLLNAIPSPIIKKAVVISIPSYVIFSLVLSTLHYHFTGFPGLNIELEAILLSILCTYILFNLDVNEEGSVLRNQYFWICSGILIFFGTTFFFNGLLTYVLSFDVINGVKLFGLINKPLNLILYAFILIGIICSVTQKKLSIQ